MEALTHHKHIIPLAAHNPTNDTTMEKKVEEERGHNGADIESGREGISHWNLITDQGVVTKEIIEWEYEGAGTETDPYVVEWIENDPRNPMNWSTARKWIMALAVANTVLVVSFCSSAFSGGTLISPMIYRNTMLTICRY